MIKILKKMEIKILYLLNVFFKPINNIFKLTYIIIITLFYHILTSPLSSPDIINPFPIFLIVLILVS